MSDVIKELYQGRVIDEKKELDAKIVALGTSITSNPTYLKLEDEDKGLLLEQRDTLQKYSSILSQRINRF